MSDDTLTRNGVAHQTLIPKEQMTAYQRWELSSFDKLISAPTASLPTAGELQDIQQQAQSEGYAIGQSTGYSAGHEAGYTAGIQQAQAEANVMRSLLQNLQSELNQMDQQIAQSLLDLSLSIANKMVSATLQVKPEIILDVIREALGSLPQFNQNAHLVLHPEDAELVRKQMNDELAHAGWKIFTDAQIQRGGCLVKTAHSFVDATTEARWQRVMQSIGQDQSWLA